MDPSNLFGQADESVPAMNFDAAQEHMDDSDDSGSVGYEHVEAFNPDEDLGNASPGGGGSSVSARLHVALEDLDVSRRARREQPRPGGGVPRPFPPGAFDDNAQVIVGGEEEAISGQWENFPFDQNDWSFDICVSDHCCFCTASVEESANDDFTKLFNFCRDNYSKMRHSDLGKRAKALYERWVMPFTHAKKEMRCRTFVEHFEKHAPSALVQLEHQNLTLNNCIMEQANLLRQKEANTGKCRLNPHEVNLYLKLVEAQNKVNGQLSRLRGAAGGGGGSA
jgi:hypothetical protein